MLKPLLEFSLIPRFQNIVGLDEVGRGCIAGPVVAAAVCFFNWDEIAGINDSKKVSAKKRVELAEKIKIQAHVGIGVVEPTVIDEINILKASHLAMKKALEKLSIKPEYLLIDGHLKLDINISQQAIIKGDSLCYSIAAASIVAKVYRDHLMQGISKTYPGFGFEKHVGYPTPYHLEAVKKLGITPLHRKTFRGVKEHV